MSQGLNPNSQLSSTEAQNLESVQRDYLVDQEAQHSLQQISSLFHEALRLEPLNHTSEIKNNNAMSITDVESERGDVKVEHTSSTASPPSEVSIHPGHSAEAAVDNTADAGFSEKNVSTGQANSLSSGKILDTPLLDERALLACIVRTIPPGGKIHISSTLPNRLGKMLAPLHWHDYRKKYGKLDDFVSCHPELFVIEEDYIQLRDGAQGIIAATAAVAKVAAAVASSSPYSSLFPPVAVTPMANTGRAKKFQQLEPQPVRTSADCTRSSVIQSQHLNGSGFVVSGGFSNVKILSKSKDSSEPNSEIRPGQPIMVPVENGAHSDRFGLGNLQSHGPIHTTRTSAGFVGQQPGRSSCSQFPSRR